MDKPVSPRSSSAVAKVYGVELFYENTPRTTKEQLFEILKKRSPDIAPVAQERDTGPWVFEHQEHPVPPGGGAARSLVAVSRQRPDLRTLEPSLKQSWGWPQAAELLPRFRGSILVTDMMAAGLHHLERLVLFERVLTSVLEAYPCLAIHWQPTQQFVDPQQYLAAVNSAGGLVFTPGPLNVRLFRIVAEDPATGSAAVALAGALALEAAQPEADLRWTIHQGVEMGRPSQLYAEASKRGGKVVAVRVGGYAVRITEGRIQVPV